MSEPIFHSYQFGPSEKEQLDSDGHFVFPGLLTESTQAKLTESLSKIMEMPPTPEFTPQRYPAEYDEYLASLIGHPQLVELAHSVLGEDIRYDHCVYLSRAGSSPSLDWHTHSYANDRPELGFIRIFFYVNGFNQGDGSLRVIPGSHLFRQGIGNSNDEKLRETWLEGKTHPETGEPLQIVDLGVPAGTVIVMWTHALHAVAPRLPESKTRYAVVYAFRNPGAPSHARWISPNFEANPPEGAENLVSLY